MEKCIKCAAPKKTCNVLGLLSLPSSELVTLCKKRKQFLGWTAQTVADKSAVPIGTVNRFFSGELGDFRYDTAQRIVCTLWEVTPGECPEEVAPITDDASEVKMLREIVSHQVATIKHHEEQIIRLREQIDRKDVQIDRKDAQLDRKDEQLISKDNQLRQKDDYINRLSVKLGI